MKAILLLLAAAALLMPEDREGNFTIRFEPKAVLQTDAEIPFEINVSDVRHQPVEQAKVTLQIETADHKLTKVFRAPAVGRGVYLAKPVFQEAGPWNVYVEVHRNDQTASRSIEFSVAK